MYKMLLHATDLSDNHYPFCQQAVKLAHDLGAELHFIHAIEQPGSLQLAQSLGFAELINPAVSDVAAIMSVLGDDLGIPPSHQHVTVGSADQEIIRLAKVLNCDLILVGKHTSHGLPAFLGSTAHGVLQHAPCDVLTLTKMA